MLQPIVELHISLLLFLKLLQLYAYYNTMAVLFEPHSRTLGHNSLYIQIFQVYNKYSSSDSFGQQHSTNRTQQCPLELN